MISVSVGTSNVLRESAKKPGITWNTMSTVGYFLRKIGEHTPGTGQAVVCQWATFWTHVNGSTERKTQTSIAISSTNLMLKSFGGYSENSKKSMAMLC